MNTGLVSQDNMGLRSRLFNWKFSQALNCVDGESDEVQAAVKSLSELFGNVGWGLDGALGNLVGHAVENLTGREEKE